MFSTSPPPAKIARTQRTGLTPHRGPPQQTAQGSGLQSSVSNVGDLFAPKDVKYSLLGANVSLVFDRHGNIRCFTGPIDTTGATLHRTGGASASVGPVNFTKLALPISALSQSHVDYNENFIGDGEGISLVTCSVDGTVRIYGHDGSVDVLNLLEDGEDDPSSTIVSFRCDGGRIIAYTSEGNLILVRAAVHAQPQRFTRKELFSAAKRCVEGSDTEGKKSSWWSSLLVGRGSNVSPADEARINSLIDFEQFRFSEDGAFIFALSATAVATISIAEEPMRILSVADFSRNQDTPGCSLLDVSNMNASQAFMLTAEDSDGALVLQSFSCSTGQLNGPSICLSGVKGTTCNAVHCLGGKVMVVTSNTLFCATPTTSIHSPSDGESIHRLPQPIFGSRGFGDHLVLFTPQGYSAVGNEKLALEEMSDEKVVSEILSAEGTRTTPDDIAMHLSEEIIAAVEVNAANWARSDLDTEDENLLTFVTEGLNRRTANHRRLISQIFSSVAALDALTPKCQANLLSDQEQFLCLVALRELQNEECTSLQVEARQEYLKQVVTAAAGTIRSESRDPTVKGLTSAAELAYAGPKSLSALLREANRQLKMIGEGPSHLSVKVGKAIAAGQIWRSVLEAVGKNRLEFAVRDECSAFMWVVEPEFEALLTEQATMLSDVLAMLGSIPEESLTAAMTVGNKHVNCSKVAADIEELANLLGYLLRSVLTYNSSRATIGYEALTRTLLRFPFVDSVLGYPHGVPRPSSTNPVVGNVALTLAETLSIDFDISDALFLFACSDYVPAPLETPQYYAKLQRYCQRHSGFLTFAMRGMMNFHREEEVELLPQLLPEIPHAETVRNTFIVKEVPHLHFVVDPIESVRSIVLDGKQAQAIPLGDDAVEHRINSLALAKLAWVAADRPSKYSRRLVDDTRIAKAQQEHLPHLSTNLGAEGAVSALLETDSAGAWTSAAQIADKELDDDLRSRLLMCCLLHAASAEKNVFRDISELHSHSAGETEVRRRIENTATAKVCSGSKIICHWLVSSNEVVKAELANAGLEPTWRLLKDWCRSVIGGGMGIAAVPGYRPP